MQITAIARKKIAKSRPTVSLDAHPLQTPAQGHASSESHRICQCHCLHLDLQLVTSGRRRVNSFAFACLPIDDSRTGPTHHVRSLSCRRNKELALACNLRSLPPCWNTPGSPLPVEHVITTKTLCSARQRWAFGPSLTAWVVTNVVRSQVHWRSRHWSRR